MDNVLIFGFVFLLSLFFLRIVFGERFSFFGFVDDRWLSAPLDVVSWFWDLLCEAADRTWCFVFDHFWWVAATASGGIGLLIVAFMLATGLADQAEADRLSIESEMNRGSVLDHTDVVEADRVVRVSAADVAPRIDQLVYQTPSPFNRFHIPPDIREVITDFGSPRDLPPPAVDVPPLETIAPYLREPNYSRSRLSISLQPFIERQGKRIRSPRSAELIRNALFSLRRDDWLAYSAVQAAGRETPVGQVLREDSEATVNELTNRVSVIPGNDVAVSELKIEKVAPEDAGNGEFEIQIRITNESRGTIDGLIVREMLPISWRPISVFPNAVFRDSVVTWLVKPLRPFEEETLSLRVFSEEMGRFESYTEVSATSAVVAAEPRISEPPRRPTIPERTLPPVVRLPKVELTLIEPPRTVNVGNDVDVLFQVKNVGDAPAVGVNLRVHLPLGLDHHDLLTDELDRRVDARIRTLQPNEKRQMRLTVQPTTRGRHFATAELMLQESQLDLRDFEIYAEEAVEPPPPAPVPEIR